MAQLSNNTVLLGDDVLSDWVSLDSGGFGHVYKVMQTDWGFDVAIKLLHNTTGPVKENAVYEEVTQMELASCEFVLRVYGIYQGSPPVRGPSLQQGIVMEFMRRGSIQSLQNDLCGPPPWPLAFRLAYQVSCAMNFLHSRKLLHHDLKPSNVLLNDDLIAKLADFGLSRVSTSALHNVEDMSGDNAGSYQYMPPEAFDTSYEPVRAFDVYSFGILLWSILTGEEPYPMKDYTLVSLRIPLGDRPPCEKIVLEKADGLKDMVDLMKSCWQKYPSRRPSFKECMKVTKCVLTKHERGVRDAVNQVLTTLESKNENQHPNTCVGFSPPTTDQFWQHSYVGNAPFKKSETSLKQGARKTVDIKDLVTASPRKMSAEEKAKFIDDKRPDLIQKVSEVMALTEELGSMVHPETYSVIGAKDTNQKKMRVLYERTLLSGGTKVKAAFYDSLTKHHPELVDMLHAQV